MNRYPYRHPLSITSNGRSPEGGHLYTIETVRYSLWEGVTRLTRPRWRVSLPEPLEGLQELDRLTALSQATPAKFQRTLWAREEIPGA